MKILFLPVKSEFVNYADQYYHDIDDVIYEAGYDAYVGPFVCFLALLHRFLIVSYREAGGYFAGKHNAGYSERKAAEDRDYYGFGQVGFRTDSVLVHQMYNAELNFAKFFSLVASIM